MGKRIFILLFAAGLMLLITPMLSAFTEETGEQILQTSDNFTYVIKKLPSGDEEGEVSVKAANKNISGEIVIPSDFTDSSGKRWKVTSIAYLGFSECDKITSVSIPNSIKVISGYAFFECDKITNISIPDGVTSIGEYAFYDCRSLKSITIPKGITEIKKGLYEGCENLTSVSIPDGVKSIGEKAFSGCEKITSVNIPGSVTSIGKDAFYRCEGLTNIKIPAGVSEIGGGAFWYCTNLETVDFENNSKLKSIGSTAFTDCYKLKNIKIPAKTESIGAAAFASCNSLESIEIPASVISIGDSAFSGCKNLSNVAFAQDTKIEKIGKSTFQLTALTKIEIPASVTSIGESAFDACSQLKKVTLNNNLTEIGAYAFNNCKNLEDINLDISSLKTIGESAFSACKKLKNIKLSNLVESIGKSAFSYCENLENIELGRYLKSIGDEAFEKCTKLKKIHIPQIYSPYFGERVFLDCTSLGEVYYPESVDIKTSGVPEKATLIKYRVNTMSTISIVRVDVGDYLPSLDIEERIFGQYVLKIEENCFDNVQYKYPSRIRLPRSVVEVADYTFVNLRGLIELCYPENLNISKTGISEETIKIAYAIEDENVIIKRILLWTNPVDLKIPESICGRPVVKIDKDALKIDVNYTNTIVAIGFLTYDILATGLKDGIFMMFNVIGTMKSIDNMLNNLEEQNKIRIALKSVTIPDNVVEIGEKAFSDNDGLEKVIFTSNSKLNSIGSFAFEDCENLNSMELPPSLSILGTRVFDVCPNFKEIYLPMKFSQESISISERVSKIYYSVHNNEVIIEKIVLGAEVSKIALPNTICGLRVAGVSDSIDSSIYTFGENLPNIKKDTDSDIYTIEPVLPGIEEDIDSDLYNFDTALSESEQDSNNNAVIDTDTTGNEGIGSSKKQEITDSSNLNNYKNFGIMQIIIIIFLLLAAQFLGIKKLKK